MAVRYLEVRGRVRDLAENVAADVMRHFQARQYLGKAVVVCDEPEAWLAAAERQWHKLGRALQRRRAQAVDADEILRHTATITHMQQVRMMSGAPADWSEAVLYALRPDQIGGLPASCLTLYLTRRLPEAKLQSLLATMPSSGLVVDYAAQLANGDFGLYSRAELELRAAASWRAVASLLETAGVDLAVLGNPQALELAVDDLLDMQDTYLQAVAAFQYALNLARPLRTITQMQRKQYEMALVLAQHVQALGPGRLPADFLKTDLDDSFYLSEAWAMVTAGTRGLASLAARPGLVLVR